MSCPVSHSRMCHIQLLACSIAHGYAQRRVWFNECIWRICYACIIICATDGERQRVDEKKYQFGIDTALLTVHHCNSLPRESIYWTLSSYIYCLKAMVTACSKPMRTWLKLFPPTKSTVIYYAFTYLYFDSVFRIFIVSEFFCTRIHLFLCIIKYMERGETNVICILSTRGRIWNNFESGIIVKLWNEAAIKVDWYILPFHVNRHRDCMGLWLYCRRRRHQQRHRSLFLSHECGKS